MKWWKLGICGLLLAVAGNVPAFDAVGIVKTVNSAAGTVTVFSNGRDRVLILAPDLLILNEAGQPLPDGPASKELLDATVTVTVNNSEKGPTVQTIRLGGGKENNSAASSGPVVNRNSGKPSVGFKPLSVMSAEDRYKGEEGGLYGDGLNVPPPAHLAAAQKQTEQIVPLDAAGNPSKEGKIGLVSISMSNATQEYSRFKQIADGDPQKSPQVAIVDCAQGGQAMAQWVNLSAKAWTEADRRLVHSGITPEQVQVIWVKLANVSPRGDLAEHGKKLQADTLAVLQNAKARFPNLRIAYLGSRIYGGYASTQLNPEPYAYEGAFAARWLIQDQIKGKPDLQYEGNTAKVPLLLWGPYFWADGTTPRSGDGLVWLREDLREDGTHPSESGRQKVAEMLLNFFRTDPLASTWFVKHSD